METLAVSGEAAAANPGTILDEPLKQGEAAATAVLAGAAFCGFRPWFPEMTGVQPGPLRLSGRNQGKRAIEA